jgi:hypothetical protein
MRGGTIAMVVLTGCDLLFSIDDLDDAEAEIDGAVASSTGDILR